MFKTGRLFAGVCVVVLAASSLAFAKEGHDKDPQKHLDQMSKKLDLTPEQRTQVEQIMNDYRSRMDSLHQQMEALKKEKHDKINAVLTPKQQEKFQKMHDKRESRGWHKRHDSSAGKGKAAE